MNFSVYKLEATCTYYFEKCIYKLSFVSVIKIENIHFRGLWNKRVKKLQNNYDISYNSIDLVCT